MSACSPVNIYFNFKLFKTPPTASQSVTGWKLWPFLVSFYQTYNYILKICWCFHHIACILYNPSVASSYLIHVLCIFSNLWKHKCKSNEVAWTKSIRILTIISSSWMWRMCVGGELTGNICKLILHGSTWRLSSAVFIKGYNKAICVCPTSPHHWCLHLNNPRPRNPLLHYS